MWAGVNKKCLTLGGAAHNQQMQTPVIFALILWDEKPVSPDRVASQLLPIVKTLMNLIA